MARYLRPIGYSVAFLAVFYLIVWTVILLGTDYTCKHANKPGTAVVEWNLKSYCWVDGHLASAWVFEK